MTRLPADIRISLKKQGVPTRRIELVRHVCRPHFPAGEITEAVREPGFIGNIVVIFTSDNGEMRGVRGLAGKRLTRYGWATCKRFRSNQPAGPFGRSNGVPNAQRKTP